MMKKVLSIALATMALMAVNVNAQSASGAEKNAKCPVEQCANKDCKGNKDCKASKDCKGKNACDKKDCKRNEAGKVCPDGKRKNNHHGVPAQARFAQEESYDFTTLNLSDDQLAKVNALNAATAQSRREQMQQMREAHKNQKDSVKAAKNDMRAERRDFCKENRKKYLKDLRVILTEDQYIQFLEDNYTSQGNGAPNGMKERRVGKDFRGSDNKGNIDARRIDGGMVKGAKAMDKRDGKGDGPKVKPAKKN